MKIWKDFGGDALQDSEALYFFTLENKGSRIDRKVGKKGSCHAETGAADVEAAHPKDWNIVVFGVFFIDNSQNLTPTFINIIFYNLF